MKLITAGRLNRLWKEARKEATPSAAGLMSAKDKEKLDGIDENLMTSVDTSLSLSSTNPVQNRTVTEELGKKAEGKGLKFSVVGGILTVTYQE